MADGDLAPLLQLSNHLPLSTRKNSKELTIGERSPASVLSVLGVADAWVPLSVTRFLSLSFIQILDFVQSCKKKYIFCFRAPKIGKQIL
jgi:hypothetical protein